MKKLWALVCLLVMVGFSSAYADSIGGRVAVGEGNAEEEFDAYELFLVFDLPWGWDRANSRIQTQIELTAGMLEAADQDGFLGTLGPRVAFQTERVSVDVGIGVAVVGETRFGRQDFGGKSQFTFQTGLAFGLTRNINAGIRYRHMSDAEIHDNGGDLNLILVELSYDFNER
jgi:opacity protein-like surface antigen